MSVASWQQYQTSEQTHFHCSLNKIDRHQITVRWTADRWLDDTSVPTPPTAYKLSVCVEMFSGAAQPITEPDWLGLFTLLAGGHISLHAIQLKAEIIDDWETSPAKISLAQGLGLIS